MQLYGSIKLFEFEFEVMRTNYIADMCDVWELIALPTRETWWWINKHKQLNAGVMGSNVPGQIVRHTSFFVQIVKWYTDI